MSSVTVYHLATGRILHSISSDGQPAPQAQAGEAELPGVFDDMLYYVSNDTATPRPEMPVQVVGSVVTAPAGVAYELWFAGTQVSDGVSETGVMDFEIPVAGTYELCLANFPYLDAAVTLSI